MASNNSIANQIIRLGEKYSIVQLRKLVEKTSTKTLTTILVERLERKDCSSFWNYLLLSLNVDNYEAKEKRFACVKCFLDGVVKIELSYKETYDLVTRLCQDLPSFSGEQLVEIMEHCMDTMRSGDPKCVGWKDLLPETLQVISEMPKINVNGINKNGKEYRDATVNNLCSMRWPTEVLTPIANMFKDLNLTAAEIQVILHKFTIELQEMAPNELPALANQLFSWCSNASQVIIPIMAMEKYFYRYHYKKLFMDMNSNSTDFDSIDKFSDKELRESEETILHLLNYCTQYKISELQLLVVLKNFQSMPDVVLTPFIISAILSMSVANREPNSRLTSTSLLQFIRSVIKNNEDERSLADYSVWCRDSLQRKQVDLEQIFTVLIDQNKDGKDVITPGLVNLAFLLLKTRNNKALNFLAIRFLTVFIRKRFVFGKGVVKKLAEWLVVEQDQNQFSECLTILSVADTFTVSECIKTIGYVTEYLLSVDGEQAMRMMSFILPVLKISAKVRDSLIEVLRRAINSSDVKTRRMAVYGFCMILKQLNNSNSQRSQMSTSGAQGFCTQHTISGFSLMSQATLGASSNPQRHFNMLTLEIIGLLRNCLYQTLEIKCTLYENLQRAVELNHKLAPHILQFIDYHFRSYFLTSTTNLSSSAGSEIYDTNEFSVNFEKLVYSKNGQDNEIEVNDNLGRLILFLSHSLTIFEKCDDDYDTREIKSLLDLSIEKTISRELKFDEATGPLTPLKHELIAQQLNFIESLMAYKLFTSKKNNENVKHILPLFRVHQKLFESFKQLSGKKTVKKLKNVNETEITHSNATINGVPVKKLNKNLDNIWDLTVIEKFLRLLHEDIVPFANANNCTNLRSSIGLICYVFEVAALKIEAIRHEPEYKQLAHSKRTLKYLTDITKVIYERCIKRLPEIWHDFDLKAAVLAAECFQQCLTTANEMYKKKFADDYVKGFDFHSINNCKQSPEIIQEVIDVFMKEHETAKTNTESDCTTKDAWRIPQALLCSLEVLYDNISYENRITIESYTWLLKFCKEYKIEVKELQLVHKLLFTQRQKTHLGEFFNTVAFHLGKVWGFANDSEEYSQSEQPLQLKSITDQSAESCLNYLYGTVRKQIEDVEYFITKANNLNFKYRVIATDDRDLCQGSLLSLERSICSQLVHISKTLLNLTNVCIPLGTSMDNLLKLLMQHYNCLKNLAKHFLSCCAVSTFSIQGTRFDLLLKVVGKTLAANIYELITYVESNILQETKKKKRDPQAEKAKILKETKLIPKVVHFIENFNKHVILLSKKTNERLANHVHLGVVRDFRISTKELRAAIERTLSHSSEIEVDPSVEDGSDQNDAEEMVLDQMDPASDTLIASNEKNAVNLYESGKKKSSRTRKKVLPTTIQSDDEDGVLTTPDDILGVEENFTGTSQLHKNLEKINKKAKKRNLRESEKEDAVIEPQPKKRRGRSSKK